MLRTLNLFLLLLLFCMPAFAQKKELKVKYGKISEEEMAMTSYKDDPAAPAVVLFDKGNLTHRYVNDAGFILEYERHVRIKIFNKEAYSLADVPIFHFKWQNIQDLKASSYNLEGGKIVETKLDKENVFDEKLTRSRLVKKMTIPAVREGSIIEYKYTIVDDDGVGIPDWSFQRVHVPTIWSEFEASVPSFIEFRKIAQGWTPFSLADESKKESTFSVNYVSRSGDQVSTSTINNVQVQYQASTMHFIQEKVPALKPEPFIGSARDYLSQINFDVQAVYQTDIIPSGTSYRLVNGGYKTFNNNWRTLGREMLEDAYDDMLKSSKYTGDAAQACVAGKASAAEKVAAIYAHIGQNYQTSDLDHLWKSQTMESLSKNRKGTPTDLNLLFINMLRRADIKAYPVLISTRDHGRVLPYRVSTEGLNRVIAAVETGENMQVLIDMAAWPNPIGLLPEEDLNREGLLLESDESITWIPLANKVAVRKAVVADLALTAEKGLAGTVTFSESGYGAVEARTRIREKGAQSFIQEQFKDLIGDGSATDLNLENADNWQEPALKGAFMLATPAFVNVSGNRIYLTPALGFGLKENPFKNPERVFNVDLGTPGGQTCSLNFKIPAGYSVEEMPKSAKLTFGENALTFDYLIENTADQIRINIRMNTKKPYISVEQYEDLRTYFGSLIAKLEEQIVLTKS